MVDIMNAVSISTLRRAKTWLTLWQCTVWAELFDPQLMAGIGDIFCFHRRESLSIFFGINQSRKYKTQACDFHTESLRLCKTLFQIMNVDASDKMKENADGKNVDLWRKEK